MYKVYADDVLINDPSAASENAITGTVTKAVNGIDSFVFRIYSNNTGWDRLECLKTHIDAEDVITGDKHIFHGRILTISPTQESSGLIYKDIQCEGELSYLQDSTQFYHNLYHVPIYAILGAMLNDHNAQVDDGKKIYLGQYVTGMSISFEWGYGKTWETLQELLSQEGVGGEIRLRYEDGERYLDYTNGTFSGGSDTVIEAGVNLISLTQTIDPTAMITDLYAYGAKTGGTEQRVALPDVIYDEARRTLAGGIVAGTVIFDDITDTTALETAAQAYFDAMRPIRKQYRITAADLSLIDSSFDEFRLGYQYRSKNPLIGVDEVVRLIGIQIKIEDRTKNTLTFGDKFDTLTAMTSKKSKSFQMQLDKQPELIQGIVEHQSEMIRGVEGGYRYDRLGSDGKPLETIYMNSPDVDTATQALRINQNGLGFWKKSTGGGTPLTGNYDYAWTIDGLLNTAYLVAQVITGLKINNGNGTFEVDENGNVTANSLTSTNAAITGGSFKIETNDKDKSYVALSYDNGQIKYKSEYSATGVKCTYIDSQSNEQTVTISGGRIAGYWGNTLKFSISPMSGNFNIYGVNGVSALNFMGDTNMLLIKDSSGNTTVSIDGNTGQINCDSVYERNP